MPPNCEDPSPGIGRFHGMFPADEVGGMGLRSGSESTHDVKNDAQQIAMIVSRCFMIGE